MYIDKHTVFRITDDLVNLGKIKRMLEMLGIHAEIRDNYLYVIEEEDSI